MASTTKRIMLRAPEGGGLPEYHMVELNGTFEVHGGPEPVDLAMGRTVIFLQAALFHLGLSI
jgi:hypothetical protein